MIYSPGTIVRILHEICINPTDPSEDLFEGDTAVILGTEEVTFDYDNPKESTETLYKCLIRGRIERLFETDFELISRGYEA